MEVALLHKEHLGTKKKTKLFTFFFGTLPLLENWWWWCCWWGENSGAPPPSEHFSCNQISKTYGREFNIRSL